MTFDNFCIELKKYINAYFDDENIITEIKEVNKLNSTYTGILIKKKDCPAYPTYNLSYMYELFQNDSNQTIQEFAEYIYHNAMDIWNNNTIDESNIDNYNKNLLFLRVCGIDKNRDTLANAPHVIIADDLALTYYLLVEENGDDLFTCMITNDLMESYELTKEQLYNDAMENAPKIMPIEIVGSPFIPENKMLMVSNERITFGGSALFYPGVMEDISKSFGGAGYFVIPSTIHEFMIFVDDGIITLDFLQKTFDSVRAELTDPREIINENIYYYNTYTKQLCLANKVYSEISDFNCGKLN